MKKILKPIKKHLRVWHIAIIVMCFWVYFATFIAFLRTLLITILGLFFFYKFLNQLFNERNPQPKKDGEDGDYIRGERGGLYEIRISSRTGKPYRHYF